MRSLDNHLAPKRYGFAEKSTFYSATQRPGESHTQWAARIRGLAAHCGFKNLEEALLDKFVMGMAAGHERNKLFTQDQEQLTLATAQAPGTSAAAGAGADAAASDSVFNISKKEKCNVCGFTKHRSNQCGYKNYRCQKYNRKGHLRKMCTFKDTVKYVAEGNEDEGNDENSVPDLINEFDKRCADDVTKIFEERDNSVPDLINEFDKRSAEDVNQMFEDRDDGQSLSSDLDVSRNIIAEEMSQIIGNNYIFGSDYSIAESVQASPKCSRSPIRVSETESELFGSDFSDNDPTFQPNESLQDSSSNSEDENNLGRLADFLDRHINNNVADSRLEPQPGPSWQRVESQPGPSWQNVEPQPGQSSQHVESQPGPSSQFVEPPPVRERISIAEFVEVILTECIDMAWHQVKPRSRRRTANEREWKKNVAKKRRTDGFPYVTNNVVRAAKVPQPIDCSKCIFKCTDNFSSEYREEMCRSYWNLDFVGKKNLILSRLIVQQPKRAVVQRKRPRPYTTKCFFDLDTDKKQVCQPFFCATLSISAGVIKDAIQHRNTAGVYSMNEDPRGPKEPSNKTTAARVKEVIDHINSFPKMEGHYIRKKSKRQYLEACLNISKMYALYSEQYNENPVSETTYRRIFSKGFNLSFFVPKKDQCQTCNKYQSANEETKIKLEIPYQQHIERKVKCTQEKDKDKIRAETDQNFLSASFDLQAILQIPCSKVGLLYYVRKLTLYNLCIYESAVPNNGFCFPWSEVHGKKGSCEIGTILLYYLTECVPNYIREVSLFSDTCGGQNRNQFVTALLMWAVNTIDNLHVIEQKFLESGHSYMEADSMHSAIENAKRHCDVFSITDWKNIFCKARTKAFFYLPNSNKKVRKPAYNVKEFKFYEFYDLKTLAETMLLNKKKDNNGNQISWLKIKRIKHVKGDKNVYFNYDMSNDFKSFDPRPPPPGPRTRKSSRKSNPCSVESVAEEDFQLPTLKELYQNSLTISAAKKKDLLNLCVKGVIPEEFHGWFDSLNCDTNIVDRIPDVDVADTTSSEERC